jgi:ABC-type transport system involved in multi-copper enzyme maturation permease subunit
MFAVFRRILKDKRNNLIAYLIGSTVFIEMYLSLFPTLKQQADMLNKLLESYPKGLMSAVGFEGTAAFFSNVENYMSTEFFTLFWPILTITMMISFANSMVVAEIERGTIETVLAQPISRLKLFFTRYLAGAFYFAIFSGVSIFSIVLSAKLHGFDYQLRNYFTIWGVGFLFGMAIFSVASFFSSVFSERGRATFATTAIIIAMYALNIISGLKDSLKDLRYFSFFHYMNAPMLLGKNQIPDWSLLVFGGAIVVFTAAAAFWFNRRDVAV